jgi:hypothetical protein
MRRYMVLSLAVLSISAFASSALAQSVPKVHSVWAQKPLYLRDGDTGASYNLASGTATMNWKDATPYAFFEAVGVPITPLPVITKYEFILVHITSTSEDLITGLFDIYKNGRIVCNDCVGKAYGIDQAPGNYFKLYVGDSTGYSESWHFSAYITNRLDY